MYGCMYVCMYVRKCVCMNILICVYIYVYKYVCVCMYVCMYVYMYIKGSPVEIRSLTQRNLFGESMIALPPSSNFPPNSWHCPLFPVKENLVHVYKMTLFHIFNTFKLSKSKIV
jgi:hypothetical protein